MNQKIVGRKAEQEILEKIFTAREAHFLAITGRRRVGKTHLIKTYFAQQLNFDFSGILNATTAQQLNNFYYSIQQQLKPKKKVHAPANWIEAFQLLSQCLEAKSKKRIVVFIDELPWLDTHKSNFTAALDWFWNSWAAHKNVLLIVCGSSTSWMMEKIVNSKGGLHNRITKRIDLSPFTLNETEDFFSYKGYSFSRYHILQLYMAMGGIPHYLKEIKKGESAAQAIHRICFQKSGLLVNEFDNLYSALFKNSEQHIQVIFALSKKQNGLTRNEILAKLKTKDGGTFTKVLAELEMCHFVLAQPPFGKSKKETVYRLIDEFSLFYIQFMHKKKNVNWQQLASSPTWKSWSGYAFENICLKHVHEIKRALGISGIYTEESSFFQKGTRQTQGAQIDLLIDRNDHAINLCEAKFYEQPFTITKKYAAELQNKMSVFKKTTGTTKTIFLTFISAQGLTANMYSNQLVHKNFDMNIFFR